MPLPLFLGLIGAVLVAAAATVAVFTTIGLPAALLVPVLLIAAYSLRRRP